jgi:hypothetical protein
VSHLANEDLVSDAEGLRAVALALIFLDHHFSAEIVNGHHSVLL